MSLGLVLKIAVKAVVAGLGGTTKEEGWLGLTVRPVRLEHINEYGDS